MKRFVMTFIIVYIVWIFLVHTLDTLELLTGAAISLVVTFVTREFFTEERRHRMIFNPMNWLRVIGYTALFIYAEAVSHIDVMKRVFTGNVRPAIIRVPTRFRSDLGKTLVANSITLTPGTLTLEAGKDLFVHTINYRKDYKIGKIFEKYGIGVTE